MKTLLASCLALLILLSAPAHAQNTQSFGDYQVYYNAFPSGILQPEMAQNYGVFRSRTRGVLMISVHEDNKPITARIRIDASDAGGGDVPVELRRLRSGNTYSYLGTFPIENEKRVRFRLEIIPEGSSDILHVAFSRTFHVD
ncbi:hypothetical protein CAI21_00645 [Alkalilimnicola ehrlichii]|uniref:DUF4426 domain-containing protein n=1 Tax=Alkalilimnicola ehrlichii TaxID=351052 RepID=A0A3E0X1J3_9GAMM|nr:DUF4426 domain-containing protein [Alkalilimnicola ehrlichii]RFA31195.1 hypothetical protein CAI21_00645 [Alkalilimnicola ehrlichii]RFA39523.1 hypothetical protein CAL65_01765 [Alkalilimnicola ehrlichii]